MKMPTILGVSGLALALAGPALAQNNSNEAKVSGSLSAVPVAPTGVGLQLGGGVTGFSRQAGSGGARPAAGHRPVLLLIVCCP